MVSIHQRPLSGISQQKLSAGRAHYGVEMGRLDHIGGSGAQELYLALGRIVERAQIPVRSRA